MSRSVSYPHDASIVTFYHDREPKWEELNEQEDPEYDYDDIVESYREVLKTEWGSIEDADFWIGREDHVVARNEHAYFGLSEYMDLWAYWVVNRRDYDGWSSRVSLAEHWIAQIKDAYISLFGNLKRLGTFSNGEGVYEPINKEAQS